MLGFLKRLAIFLALLLCLVTGGVLWLFYGTNQNIDFTGGQPPTQCKTDADCTALKCISGVWYCDHTGRSRCDAKDNLCTCSYGCM